MNQLKDYSDLACRYCGEFVVLTYRRYKHFILSESLPVCSNCLRLRKHLKELDKAMGKCGRVGQQGSG